METVHFLHIGKTGGSAIKTALGKDAATRYDVVLCGHGTNLTDIPSPGRVMFGVRDPVSRFVSSFNSRLRKGQPKHFVDWFEGERRAFAVFTSPNMLAEALSSDDEGLRAAAEDAMVSIYHVARPLSKWLISAEYLRSRRADISWIWYQPELDSDFAAIRTLIGLPEDLALPADLVGAHRTPPEYDTGLSALARANLEAWYKDDFPILAAALDIRETLRESDGHA